MSVVFNLCVMDSRTISEDLLHICLITQAAESQRTAAHSWIAPLLHSEGISIAIGATVRVADLHAYPPFCRLHVVCSGYGFSSGLTGYGVTTVWMAQLLVCVSGRVCRCVPVFISISRFHEKAQTGSIRSKLGLRVFTGALRMHLNECSRAPELTDGKNLRGHSTPLSGSTVAAVDLH